MIRIAGLSDAIAALDRTALPAATARGTQAAARLLQDAVSASLSHPPGVHRDLPALRSGALRASVTAVSDTNGVIISSDSPVAVYQELGTAHLPPRPFFAPVAAAYADAAAQVIADAIRAGADT